MAVVQKHVIWVKIYIMPLWNIRNKLCDATTQISRAINVEERRNGDQEFQKSNQLV